MSEHERIWLEPAPGADEDYGRQWCQHNVWPDGVEYVRADTIPEAPIELSRVAEELSEASGAWVSCSGCHELNEGVPTGEWSNVLKCHLGIGCRECGGIGAVWDNTDYSLFSETSSDADDASLTAERERLREENERLRAALSTFVVGIENWTDADGWAPYAPKLDRICDWFGSGDFREAKEALS